MRAAQDAAGLRSPSGHAPFLSDSVGPADDQQPAPAVEQVLDDAAALGIDFLIDPMTAPERWASRDEVAKTAERMNRVAALAADRGIRVGYHNHAQEFHHSFDGVSAYETFVAQLEPSVQLELDAYWAAVGGQDVPALVARLGDRLKALHVKDGSTGYDPFKTGEFKPELLGQVVAGTGEVPLAAALDAASSLELAVVEYDHVPGDVFAAIAGSVAFLAERGIR
ncbi:sugar phosphate isomerase/epimerase family protein [Microbacterium mangrovi]|uniref:sugar phosphate isomerase/epimerase family protein n=1 Tax=Microbacterium mangrovi TaxID=1348253 RepID=UPI002F42F81C